MTLAHARSLGPKGLVVAAALALASRAAAQAGAQQAAPSQTPSRPAAAETSDAFDRACVDLIHGKTPKGEKATDALRDACSNLMKARTDERRKAEEERQAKAAQAKAQPPARAGQAPAQAGRAGAQPGQSAAAVEPGQSALAAFAAAGNELVGNRPRGMMGLRRSGEPFTNTITTNPVGWFTGVGVNAEVLRSFYPQWSWSAGAHYSQTNASNASLYTLGFQGGVDYFIVGRHNEGLRLGPRFDVSFGREADPAGGNSNRARLGITGELGYNFLATNGITGQAAAGVGGRVVGDKNSELSSGFGGDFGPYVKLGVGYSW